MKKKIKNSMLHNRARQIYHNTMKANTVTVSARASVVLFFVQQLIDANSLNYLNAIYIQINSFIMVNRNIPGYTQSKTT